MSKALAYAPAVNTAKLIYQVMNRIHSMVLFQSTNTQSFLYVTKRESYCWLASD